jgi:hypothetical protein
MKLHKNGKKSDRNFFFLYIIQKPLKDDFLQFFSLKKHFFKKMLGHVLVKKSSFLGATLNLHRGKTVKFFFTFSSAHDSHGQDLSNKKNQSSLSCLYPEI